MWKWAAIGLVILGVLAALVAIIYRLVGWISEPWR